jgi:hypothetical protein
MTTLKQIFTGVVTGAVLGLAAVSTIFAQDKVIIEDPLKGKKLEDIIQGIINFIFGLALLICPIFIIWGGFEIATASGSDEKIKEGKKKITYALVGLVIIALSSTFVAVIKNILGVSD